MALNRIALQHAVFLRKHRHGGLIHLNYSHTETPKHQILQIMKLIAKFWVVKLPSQFLAQIWSEEIFCFLTDPNFAISSNFLLFPITNCISDSKISRTTMKSNSWTCLKNKIPVMKSSSNNSSDEDMPILVFKVLLGQTKPNNVYCSTNLTS